MTINGWIGFLLLAFIIIGAGLLIGALSESGVGITIGGLIGVIISLFLLMGMHWYYGNTQSGARAMKSQESNFNNGIQRKVTVFDMEGDVIAEYEGRFDIEYDDDRILFDDENGLRHIIYYPTGTVLVDEVGQ